MTSVTTQGAGLDTVRDALITGPSTLLKNHRTVLEGPSTTTTVDDEVDDPNYKPHPLSEYYEKKNRAGEVLLTPTPARTSTRSLGSQPIPGIDFSGVPPKTPRRGEAPSAVVEATAALLAENAQIERGGPIVGSRGIFTALSTIAEADDEDARAPSSVHPDMVDGKENLFWKS